MSASNKFGPSHTQTAEVAGGGRVIIYDTEAFLKPKEKYVIFLIFFLRKELPREIICTLIRVCSLIETCSGEMIACSMLKSR